MTTPTLVLFSNKNVMLPVEIALYHVKKMLHYMYTIVGSQIVYTRRVACIEKDWLLIGYFVNNLYISQMVLRSKY